MRRAALMLRRATTVGGCRSIACAQHLRLHHQVLVEPRTARMALEANASVGISAKGAAQAYLGVMHMSNSRSLLSAAVGTQAKRFRTSTMGSHPSLGLGRSMS